MADQKDRAARTAFGPSSQNRFLAVAVVLSLTVGLTGLYPHLRWSWANHHVVWFHNSFDEGFYAWSALQEFAPNRWLSSLALRLLYQFCGADAQWMMIAADFVFPAGATLAACYLVRPLFSRALPMGAAALFLLCAAETLGLRTNMLLEYEWFNELQSALLRIGGGPGGLFLLGNLTSAFWMFRTPEPGITWILMFIALGLAVRLVVDPTASLRRAISFLLICLALGLGYLFSALTVGAAFLLFATLAFRPHRRLALLIGGGGVITVATCLSLSLLAANTGGSFVFSSREPALMFCFVPCLFVVGMVAARFSWSCAPVRATHRLAGAMALTPLMMANQQLITGHMIYLLNFENFGFPTLAALALLLAGRADSVRWPEAAPVPPPTLLEIRMRAIGCTMAVAAFLTLILRSQQRSYEQWYESNRVDRSYALAIKTVPVADAQILCADFIATDTLPLLLNQRPNFLLSRDTAFLRPIARLTDSRTRPANSASLESGLFSYLAATGIKPADLAERLKAVSNPQDPNWQDRALLGGFLYNQADFWIPLTHSRDTKLDWVAEQNPLIVQRYARFLEHGSLNTKMLLLFLPEAHANPAPPNGWRAEEVASNLGLPDLPLKAVKLQRITTP